MLLTKPLSSLKLVNLHTVISLFGFLLVKNNTTSSPGFLGQLSIICDRLHFWRHQFNNLQRAALLTSLVQDDKIVSKLGQQQLVMVNYTCAFNQSETGKYFESIIFNLILKIKQLCIHKFSYPWHDISDTSTHPNIDQNVHLHIHDWGSVENG